ncbi:MAG: prolyl-tRNA synthetase associated domain-containing protein, partial [Subdoligranulum sp.]|nr:prolyl-tRNA synthetase associated domain-containing protein [Subdoligranulum sp.]
MNKQEVYAFLKSQNIPFEITEHKAVFNMSELNSVDLPYPS